MKVWAITTIANEESIIGYTLSHLFSQGIDGVIVGLHNSTDMTEHIVMEMKDRGRNITIIRLDFAAFYQSRMVTELANLAHSYGADWVLPFDADELFYSEDKSLSLTDAIRRTLHSVIGVPLINHYATDRDVVSPNPFIAHPWRHVDLNPLAKMIVRFDPSMTIDNGNHRILRGEDPMRAEAEAISVRHFTAIDADRWVVKTIANATALEAGADIPEGVGAHVRLYKKHADVAGRDALKAFYYQHFFFPLPNNKMVYDPAPYTGEL